MCEWGGRLNAAVRPVMRVRLTVASGRCGDGRAAIEGNSLRCKPAPRDSPFAGAQRMRLRPPMPRCFHFFNQS